MAQGRQTGQAYWRLDQHFLDSAGAKCLVDLAEIRPTDVVVDVGAGHGELLRVMPECKQLVVIEIDPDLIGALKMNFPSAVIRQGNALDLIEGAPFDVLVSNVPFSIVEPLLFKLFRLRFRRAVLLVPSSIRDILVEKKGLLGLFASAFLQVDSEQVFDASHLSPSPNTSLSILVLSHKRTLSKGEKLLFEIYSQRDKIAGNALRESLCRINGWTKRESVDIIAKMIPESVRKKTVPNLSFEDLVLILDSLSNAEKSVDA